MILLDGKVHTLSNTTYMMPVKGGSGYLVAKYFFLPALLFLQWKHVLGHSHIPGSIQWKSCTQHMQEHL